MKKIKIFLLLMLLIEGTLSYAQITTSSISGRVTDSEGSPVETAVVVAVHTPTNSQYSAFTDNEGNYRMLNMRSGGPYLVVVRSLGYQEVKIENVNLALSRDLVLDILTNVESFDLLEVVVSSNSKNSNMLTSNAGAITNVSARDISLMPSINRKVNDVMRFTPQADGLAIGGGNYRQNFVTVDGAALNNAFGIGQNLPGDGTPISLEAVEQISISLTPYDVRQSGFIGANINAVTKSGTNDFKGSLYTYMTDDRLQGNKVGDTYINQPASKTNSYGVTFGGPILKDKLFFFVNYETQNTIAPGPVRVASEDGVAVGTTIARPTVSDMNMMSKYLHDTYGYSTGPYQNYSFESPSKKYLARIDWNITSDHKLNLRYSHMDSKVPQYPSASSPLPFDYAPGGGRSPVNDNIQNMNAMWYRNTGYFQHFNFSSFSGELNSYFLQGRLNNLLRVTYSYQDEPRSTNGKTFPFVDIIKDNAVYTSFGTELFSYNNLRQVKTWNITDELKYDLGINSFTLGLSYETNHIRNGFMRQGTGYYAFNSWNDFVNGANPAYYSITFSNAPGYKLVFPGFKFEQYSLYLQDEAKIGDRLNITGGLRFDLPTYPAFPEVLQTHPMILKLDFNGNHYNTAVMPKQRIMFSPRFGFNYDATGDRKIVVRGGAGIFTGRIPFVWICSQSGDAGMLQTTVEYRTAADIAANVGPFNPDPKAYLPAVQPPAGTSIPTGGFTVMDPDFKMPSTWKTSLAVDFQLPMGFKASIEGVYNKDINAVMIRNEGLIEPKPMNISGYPDHRLIYPNDATQFIHRLNSDGQPDENGNSGAQPLLIHNVKNNGHYSSLTFKLEKEIWEGVSGMLAYTRSWAKSLFDGYGDQSFSLWRNYTTVNGSNTPELGYASYVMPNNLIGSFSYRYKSFTTSIFYIGGNGGRASYTYTNPFNTGINLIYIPKDPSEIKFVDATVGSGVNAVTYTAQEQSDAFFRYVEQDSYLRNHKGQHAERNGVILPWVHTFDMRFTQDFTIKAGKTNHTLQLGLDIVNMGNLLNPKWGNYWSMSQSQLLEVTNVNDITADGAVVPTFHFNPITGTTEMPSKTFRKLESFQSTFQMQFSLRYIFN
ncbi:MAG: TonB-dependent receptor [Dysgonamonadaceae bacterium]|jgi:hypothetical protein|nr:TonB-dependent receptor [Dysgonamonadaceae bacterium]